MCSVAQDINQYKNELNYILFSVSDISQKDKQEDAMNQVFSHSYSRAKEHIHASKKHVEM